MVRSIDPDLPLFDTRTVGETIYLESWFYRMFGAVFVVFGIVAMFMAAAGLYGVLAFSVSMCTQEMGIRMALGVGRRAASVTAGLTHIGIGLRIGLLMAAGVSQVIEFFVVRGESEGPDGVRRRGGVDRPCGRAGLV